MEQPKQWKVKDKYYWSSGLDKIFTETDSTHIEGGWLYDLQCGELTKYAFPIKMLERVGTEEEDNNNTISDQEKDAALWDYVSQVS